MPVKNEPYNRLAQWGDKSRAFYAELQPTARHRSFIDHLFILQDCGGLIRADGSLFASSFSEIALVHRCQSERTGGSRPVTEWKAVQLSPRFGRRPRQREFHGWIAGVRSQIHDVTLNEASLTRLSEQFAAMIGPEREAASIVSALDAWIDYLKLWLQPDACVAMLPDRQLSRTALAQRARVASFADECGIAPRSVQRHFRKCVGLPPKQYLAVQRLEAALHEIAFEQDNLASIALKVGYYDQAHLSAEVRRHTGLSPRQFRFLARKQLTESVVRFFQDPNLQGRINLVVANSTTADEVSDDSIQSKRPEF
ncbi:MULTISPECIES: AraC family transcriptional regulator [unclassified Xanthobacter]|uniref:helix-turn-helix domain-containing protein n=1 Tax=Xanthobacter TaxID=279 RepID=UPI001F3971E0|nr:MULTISPECIES: helix-turn-helix transcriptional regulator [unclassified Xanthobacter]